MIVPRIRWQRGTAMIEFMIVAPLLLLLVFGVAEFGRLLQYNEILNKAVRNASRYAVEQATGETDVVQLDANNLLARIQAVAAYGYSGGTAADPPLLPGLVPGDIDVDTSGTNPDIAEGHIQVRADYDYVPLWGVTLPAFGLGDGDIGLSVPIIASSTMRIL